MIGFGESIGIDWRPDHIRAVRVERRLGRTRVVGAVSLPREGEPSLGERLLAALGPVRGQVVLGIPGQQGFLRQLALPAQDPSLLRRILEFDLERHLPLPAEKLSFDFALLGRRKGNVWNLLLAATPKQTTDATVAEVATDGVRPSGATLTPVATASMAALAGAPPGPGLVMEHARGVLRGEVLEAGRVVWHGERALPEGSEPAEAIRAVGDEVRRVSRVTWTLWMGEGSREPLERWAREVRLPCLDPLGRLVRASALDPVYTAALALALQGIELGPWRMNLLNPAVLPSRRTVWLRTAAGAALVLLIASVGWWLNGYGLDRRALAKNLAKIERLAPRVQALEAEARGIAETRRLIEGLEAARREPSKLVLLRELTLLIPRHTWLTRITYKRGEVEIAGYSSSPQEVIPRIEASPLFQQASFTGSIEREGAQERFTIRARLR